MSPRQRRDFSLLGRDGYAAKSARWADPSRLNSHRAAATLRGRLPPHQGGPRSSIDDHRELCSAAVCACVVGGAALLVPAHDGRRHRWATCYYYLPAQVAQNLGASIVLGTLVCFGLVGTVGNEKAFPSFGYRRRWRCAKFRLRQHLRGGCDDSAADALDPRPRRRPPTRRRRCGQSWQLAAEASVQGGEPLTILDRCDGSLPTVQPSWADITAGRQRTLILRPEL